MKNKHILKVLSLLAAVCIAAGCSGAEKEVTGNTASSVSEFAEPEVEYVDEDGTVYYKNPTEWTYEMVYEALTIEGKKVQAPLTFEDFGDKYSLDEATLTYFKDSSCVGAGIIYNGKNFLSAVFLDCANKGDIKNKEISLISLRNTEQELQDDFPDIKINGITLGSSRSEIISAFGTPSFEIYDGSSPYSLSYKPDLNADNRSLIFVLNNDKADIIYIEIHE